MLDINNLTTTNEAFNQGYAAFFKYPSNNPYKRGTSDYYDWSNGYSTKLKTLTECFVSKGFIYRQNYDDTNGWHKRGTEIYFEIRSDNMLHINKFLGHRWETLYKGFCDSHIQMEDIIKKLKLDNLFI